MASSRLEQFLPLVRCGCPTLMPASASLCRLPKMTASFNTWPLSPEGSDPTLTSWMMGSSFCGDLFIILVSISQYGSGAQPVLNPGSLISAILELIAAALLGFGNGISSSRRLSDLLAGVIIPHTDYVLGKYSTRSRFGGRYPATYPDRMGSARVYQMCATGVASMI